jgi:hypothetical protein
MEQEHGHVLGQEHVLDKVALWYDMFEHIHPCHHVSMYRVTLKKKGQSIDLDI